MLFRSARLLKLAGYELRATSPGRGWAGNVQVQTINGGLLVNPSRQAKTPVAFNAPLYKAGVDFGDIITSIDGAPATQDSWAALTAKAPGTAVKLGVLRRGGATVTLTLTLDADPSMQIVDLGNGMTDAQKAFRDNWLGSKVKP